MKRIKKRILHTTGNLLLPYVVTILCKTITVEVVNGENVFRKLNSGQNIVAAFWHGVMLFGWYIFRKSNFAGLVSSSKDGDILAAVLNFWKYELSRGSSNKGGKDALQLMLEMTGSGRSVAITPDGPTGPPRELKAGAVVVAKKSAIPLFLAGIGYSGSIKLKSWDKFEIPKPFSKVKIVFSDAIFIPGDAEYEKTSEIINYCEDELNRIQEEAEKF